MNIDVTNALEVQQAVDKVVQGTGVRLSSITQGTSHPMARATVTTEGSALGLHIVPLDIDGRDFIGYPLEQMETIGDNDEGLRFICKGWEYTIYPFGDAMSPEMIAAGQSYEQRVTESKQDEADTYQRLLAASEQSKKNMGS